MSFGSNLITFNWASTVACLHLHTQLSKLPPPQHSQGLTRVAWFLEYDLCRIYLKSSNGCALETKISLEVLCNLTDQSLEWQLADQQLSWLLITTDLTKCHSSWPVPMWLFHSASWRSTFTSRFCGKLFTWCLATSRLSGSLLRTSHESSQSNAAIKSQTTASERSVSVKCTTISTTICRTYIKHSHIQALKTFSVAKSKLWDKSVGMTQVLITVAKTKPSLTNTTYGTHKTTASVHSHTRIPNFTYCHANMPSRPHFTKGNGHNMLR